MVCEMSVTYSASLSSSPLQPPVLELEDGEGAYVWVGVGGGSEGRREMVGVGQRMRGGRRKW